MTALLLLATALRAQASWESEIIYYGAEDRLVYETDEEGNRIPDFSYAGYRNGNIPIPDIPVVETISPIEGDNTSHIQSALFKVGQLPRNENGFRGALLLSAGIYEIQGTIELGFDGVVLKGVGDGDDPASNTILSATGNTPAQRSVLVAGGGASTKWADAVPNTTTDIISDSAMVGSHIFEVSDAGSFAVGDNIIIYHPCTAEWLTAIDSGGTHWDSGSAEPGVDVPWEVGSQPIVYNRYITDIQGDTITTDAPVFNHLIRSLSPSYIYKYARNNLVTNIGIENLRIDIETTGGADEAHAWNAIDLYLIEDAWVRDCTMLHFSLSGIRTNTATRVTIENCGAIDPVSEIEGGKRYNFNVYTASQLILFKNCHASNGRHHYVSNGTSWTSGCVFVDCTSEGAFASSEGHRRWSTGLLFDNLMELDGPRPGYNPRLLGLYNRGYYGTSHGWAAAHSVAWACNVHDGDLIVQRPPTAQNYAIGCFGKNVTGIKPPASFDEPGGYIEGTNTSGLEPRSLYYAQLEDRLGYPVGINQQTGAHSALPESFALCQNHPNPFNSNTTIRYDLPKTSNVSLTIYDLLGREVVSLVDCELEAGFQQVVWHGRDSSGREVPSGIYITRLVIPEYRKSIKMVLLK
ncbi:MAG: T9SS type A sorting domain-containing protein [Fidelibacterota bacterium]|nr:MAG: T9SS type A sorting domain-containing protein [Candidatus Neomarinimicrobiota bacterium]